MEDAQIIDLYWQRDENAIRQTDCKYGAYCRKIALNLLGSREDAEECVNDTWHQAWLLMPPERPLRLKSYLGRIVRNISVNLWHKNHAGKRGNGLELLLSELEDCLPSGQNVEREVEEARLGEVISGWLRTLPRNDRVLFVRRYWYGDALNSLADEWGISPGKLSQRMYRLRRSLRAVLEREEIAL